jgi:hypothetical protein
MAKFSPLPLVICLTVLLAIGCGFGSKGVGVTSYTPKLELAENEKRDTRPPITQPTDENIRKTGTREWDTGRRPPPEPKALEKEFAVRGKVSNAGAGSVSLDLDGGGQKTFQTDTNTMIFMSGDSRFFAQPMPGAGATVSVIGYNKNGQDYARCISIGEGGFITTGKDKK